LATSGAPAPENEGGNMNWTRTTAAVGLSLALASGFSLVACDSTTAPSSSPTGPSVLGGLATHSHQGTTTTSGASHDERKLTPDMEHQLNDLRKLTAPFHNFDKAVEFGYKVPAPAADVCISDPVRGGMGFHYTRDDKDLIRDGVVNLLEPEFLVYAPKPNGGVKFAALDYFVPYDTWTNPEPPSLLGVPFVREDGFQAFVLHIWLYWHNPAGFFENYNPSVPLCD
jgi:hypothetical protein